MSPVDLLVLDELPRRDQARRDFAQARPTWLTRNACIVCCGG